MLVTISLKVVSCPCKLVIKTSPNGIRAEIDNPHAAQGTYPEIDLQVATASEFPVSDLEGDGHLVILVQGLVEAFAGVSPELDVVCGHGGEPRQRRDQEGRCGESHDG